MKKGFTLVELIAVIAILGIILVIAVPKLINLIQESKKSAFISIAKNIIRQIEYEDNEFENATLSDLNLGNMKTVDIDLENSSARVVEDEIYINLAGRNKYEGMYVCNLTLSTKKAEVKDESC